MEIENYPLPEWAERLNQDKELIPGTQLMTKNGMRIGNARIVAVEHSQEFGRIFTCRSDRGNEFRYLITELERQFEIGPYIISQSELTARKIVQKTCSGCQYKDHKGAFGTISCVPTCRYAKQDLPYTTTVGESGRVHALSTNVIPDWCPLEFN